MANDFKPSTLEDEKLNGGWIRTTKPEGASLSELHELVTIGSRGAEVHRKSD